MPKYINAALGILGWERVKLPPRVLYFLSFLDASTEQSIERGLTINAPQNVFWW